VGPTLLGVALLAWPDRSTKLKCVLSSRGVVMKKDLYGYKGRFERALVLLDRADISDCNKRLVFRFIDDCALDGLTKPRLIKLAQVLRKLAEMLGKDFDKVDIDDIKGLVRRINDFDLSVWTKASYRSVIKKFFKWVDGGDEYPVIVRWIRSQPKAKDIPMISKSDLITPEEVQKAIRARPYPRDKAFISLLWESGCRIGEIGMMWIKNVTIDDQGAVLTVNGKTGSRRIRVVNSVIYLADWLNNHPNRDDPEAPLWVNIGSRHHGRMMDYPALQKIVTSGFRSAGINKRCNPHLFRHSRASTMANHLTEFQMNQYFGWKQGSNMPATYVHMSGKDLDGTILKMNGLKVEEEQEVEKSKICPKCDAFNAIDSIYCSKCAHVLDEREVMKTQADFVEEQQAGNTATAAMNHLMKDPEVQLFLAQKMMVMSAGKLGRGM